MEPTDISKLEIEKVQSFGFVEPIGSGRIGDALNIIANGIKILHSELSNLSFVSWLSEANPLCPPYLALSIPRDDLRGPARYIVGFQDADSWFGWRPVSLEWPTDLWKPDPTFGSIFGVARREDSIIIHDRKYLFHKIKCGVTFGCESDFGWVPLIDVPRFGSVAELRMKMELKI